MKTFNEVDTIKKTTQLLESKNRFAFVTYTRSAIFSAIGDLKGEKKTPKYFSKSILSGLTNPDPNFIKAIQTDMLENIEDKFAKVGLKNENFYSSLFLDYYINNGREDVFETFMSYYLKHNKCIVVSFQYKNLVSKYFSKDSIHIQIPYNDFYDKIDSVMGQIEEFSPEYDLCVMDCPMFSSALAPKLWEKTKLSVLDLGKSLTVARAVARAKG